VIPALYLSHGAPPLVDDAVWVSQLVAWARELPTPSAILVVSAHWEAAPLTIGSTVADTPLTHDFWGFPQRYYDVTYDAPGAPGLAARIEALMPDNEPVANDPHRRLDHGAYVPLTVMYPGATIPVLQISMPTLDPQRLLHLGERLRPLRDDGVLIIGSGFTTHGLPFLDDPSPNAAPPGSSTFGIRLPACRMRTRPSSTSRRSSSRSVRRPILLNRRGKSSTAIGWAWRSGPFSWCDGV
jgi:4,5-DOPA dioxygenase extradiol